jgi:hypothetical protein
LALLKKTPVQTGATYCFWNLGVEILHFGGHFGGSKKRVKTLFLGFVKKGEKSGQKGFWGFWGENMTFPLGIPIALKWGVFTL